jgi:hypothetical protein
MAIKISRIIYFKYDKHFIIHLKLNFKSINFSIYKKLKLKAVSSS